MEVSASTSGAAPTPPADGTLGNQSVTDLLDELMNCPVCMQKFTKPKMLNCLHSFCQACLEMSHKAALRRTGAEVNSLACPSCREVTILTSAGIQGLKPDFKIGKITDLLNKVGETGDVESTVQREIKTCGLCKFSGKYVTAKYSCKNCSKYLCKGCYVNHSKIQLFAKHVIKDLESPSKKKKHLMQAARSEGTCRKHGGEKYLYFCRHCKVKVCTVCTIKKHRNHKLLHLKDVDAKRMNEKLNKYQNYKRLVALENSLKETYKEISQGKLKCSHVTHFKRKIKKMFQLANFATYNISPSDKV